MLTVIVNQFRFTHFRVNQLFKSLGWSLLFSLYCYFLLFAQGARLQSWAREKEQGSVCQTVPQTINGLF